MVLEETKGQTVKLIQQNLTENLETQQYLEHIKEWLKNEPHLPDEFDDPRLLTFLRNCKFSLERCKRKLDMYFTVREAFPEFFTNRDIYQSDMATALNKIYTFTLPCLTAEGYRLSIASSKSAKENDFDVQSFLKYVFMMADIRIAEDNAIGDIYIVDVLATNPRYFLKLTPTLVKKVLVYSLEALPISIKAIHVINVWPWMKTMIESLKPFVKEKTFNRFYFHSDASQLHKYVSTELLPTEYGGKAGSAGELHNAWIKKVGEYTSWFKEQENVKANESLRRDKSTTHNDVFGVQGSFRQLSID